MDAGIFGSRPIFFWLRLSRRSRVCLRIRRNNLSLKNAKAKGTRNEHRSMRLLELAGYRCCRSAASLGCWDVIGIGPTDTVLLQVKTRDWPGEVEMEDLRAFPCPGNCRKLIHRWRDRHRQPDVRTL